MAQSVAMIGHKHFGSREGGVEVVVTELATRMVRRGCAVTCFDRSGLNVTTGDNSTTEEHACRGVRIVPVRTINKKGLAALSSSFFATIKAISAKPDVIHYHAEGPCVPLIIAHWAGIRTVATIHGLDWQRAKWGKFASTYIRFGERVAARYADEVIVLSRGVQDYFKNTYGRETHLIPNGIDEAQPVDDAVLHDRWPITKDSYLLYLGRLVPEKCPDLLIRVFKELKTNKKLVIAGGTFDSSEYIQELHELAADDDRILFTGFAEGDTLAALFSNAYAYVLPSNVEGMPLSLLEAMSYGRCCITSNISECADVLDGTGFTFEKGSSSSLAAVLQQVLDNPNVVYEKGKLAKRRADHEFNWDAIVDQTLKVYEGK